MATRVEPALHPRFAVLMTLEQIAALLIAMGCPGEKAPEMARQLDKRARQLAEQTARPYNEALAHLLKLMKQGWAAKEKGI